MPRNRFYELSEKRKRQTGLALRLGIAQENLEANTRRSTSLPHEGKVSLEDRDFLGKGVSVRETYFFASEHYDKTQENILSERVVEGDLSVTLLWGLGYLGHLIDTRTLNESQYQCLQNAAEMMKRPEFSEYRSVKNR